MYKRIRLYIEMLLRRFQESLNVKTIFTHTSMHLDSQTTRSSNAMKKLPIYKLCLCLVEKCRKTNDLKLN